MALSTDSLELEGRRNLTRNLEMAAGQTGDGSEDTLAGMSDPRQLMALGASYKKEGRFAKAVQAYERVCESDKKNPDAPVQLAMCLMHAGEMERADITFQKALEFYDNVSKPELWHALGQLYALQEKSTQAEEALNQVIETATLSVDVHFRLAALACAAMNYDKAVDHLKRAASACDSDSDAEPTAAGVWFELGDVYALKGDSADESTQAFENSGLSQGDHAAWHAHGAMLDRLVGFAGKGGALRRKALRAMVRSVEMATDQPQYWHTLANLHRKMGSHDEAFSALEHYAHLSVARADRGEAEVEALRASLQEAGESTMQLSEELSRVRASYAEEQLANKDAHTQREQHARELQSSQRTVQGLHKEIDKYKGWFEAIKKENRLCKADVERAQRLVREANTRTDEALARVPPLKQEIAKQQKTIQEKARQISEMLGNQGSAEMTPLEKVEEMEQKCARLEMAAVEAEGSATEVRREAARRVREVESQSRATVEELESTRSRLAVCEKKLVAARQELGMLKGTPDGEAFAAAAKYKQEVAKSLELAKQRGAEASQAREREHLARCV
jgi:tetratricopeptide (TPR) repeat protein